MRVLIADDHDLLRDTLIAFLQAEGGIETVSAPDFPEACRVLESGDRFDLVLLDYKMPGMDGLRGLSIAQGIGGGQRVALISGEATRDIAEKALAAGAAGFVPKTLPAKSLVNAIRFMAMGEKYAPIEFLTAPEEKEPHPLESRLSTREMQVLRGLSDGRANKEIARDLGVTEPTVKLHVKTLYRKLEVSNRTQAAIVARDSGLF